MEHGGIEVVFWRSLGAKVKERLHLHLGRQGGDYGSRGISTVVFDIVVEAYLGW